MDEAMCEKCGKTIGEHFGMRCQSESDDSIWTNAEKGTGRMNEQVKCKCGHDHLPLTRGERRGCWKCPCDAYKQAPKRKLYDVKCWELACHFLSETDPRTDNLAAHIQDAVEDFLYEPGE